MERQEKHTDIFGGELMKIKLIDTVEKKEEIIECEKVLVNGIFTFTIYFKNGSRTMDYTRYDYRELHND